MSETRQKIDPTNTLPHVLLREMAHRRCIEGTERHMQFEFEGKEIGGGDIVEAPASKEAWFADIEIEPHLRKKGLGLAAYTSAIEWAHHRGETFRNDPVAQTEAAVAIWNYFIAAGIAEVVEPFRLQEETLGGTPCYAGHIRIPPLPA